MGKTAVVTVATFTLMSAIAFAAPKKVGDVVLSNLLEGTQEEDAVVLEDTKSAYVVNGEYVVPIGKTLSIKEGVTLGLIKERGCLPKERCWSTEPQTHLLCSRGSRQALASGAGLQSKHRPLLIFLVLKYQERLLA